MDLPEFWVDFGAIFAHLGSLMVAWGAKVRKSDPKEAPREIEMEPKSFFFVSFSRASF